MMGPDIAMGLLVGVSLGVALASHTSLRPRALFGSRGGSVAETPPPVMERRSNTAIALRPLFESVSDCVEVLDRDGMVLRMNGAGLAFRNQNHISRVIGRPVYDVIMPKHREAYRRMVERVFSGLPGFLEYEIDTVGRRPRWLETYAVPLHGADGVTSLLAISRELPGRRKKSRQMEEQRQRLRTIIDPRPECVKLLSPTGVVLEMNPGGLPLIHADRLESVLGKEIYEFITPEYRHYYRALSERGLKGERGVMEYEILAMNGERRWVETHAAPLFDGEGAVTTLLAITRNVADRKSIEEGLRRQRSELAHTCRLSTMGEMASGLAHELNQPLCAISSYAETAQSLSPGGNPDLDQVLGKIISETERASQIIQRVREFVRNQGPKLVPTKPAVIAESAIQLVEPERRRLGISFNLDIADDLPVLLADRVQLEQVLLNLIMNAMQASRDLPQQERLLVLTVSRGEDSTVRFSLCNRGAPIPPEVERRMFTPFYTTKEKGMGMGLAISRSIIESHNGTLGYHDDPAGGACFHFHLPAVSK